jgi:hypothetical protein
MSDAPAAIQLAEILIKLVNTQSFPRVLSRLASLLRRLRAAVIRNQNTCPEVGKLERGRENMSTKRTQTSAEGWNVVYRLKQSVLRALGHISRRTLASRLTPCRNGTRAEQGTSQSEACTF